MNSSVITVILVSFIVWLVAMVCISTTCSSGKKKRRRYDASWMYDDRWNR